MSPPSRGRGLKLEGRRPERQLVSSPPSRGRGLKLRGLDDVDVTAGRPLAGA